MEKNNYKKELGNIGEVLACKYIRSLKYKILVRNFKSLGGEIDIIAKDNNEYVFIEVKTRKNSKYGKPVDAVNYEKMKHITKVANYYIYLNNLYNKYIRFDIIEVYIKQKEVYIHHIKNVFL